MTQSLGPWSASRCVVTGASGFIGSSVGRRLRALGAHVHGLSRTQAPADAVNSWSACDLISASNVTTALAEARPEVIFHVAATPRWDRELSSVLPTVGDFLLSFINLVNAAMQTGVRRIICTGSLQEPDQTLPPVPNTPYAAAKFAASAYARMFAQEFAVPVTIVRPFMVYGPGQRDFTKLVPYVLNRLLQQQPAELSSGQQRFDWVYVDDVAEAMVLAASREDLVGATLDVGSGSLTSVAEIAVGLARRVGRPELLQFNARPDRTHESTRAADIAATAACLGWKARTPLQEGLDLTVQWYRRAHQSATI